MSIAALLPMFALATITILYASFDLFNNRNVPDAFAYGSVIVGLLIALAYNWVNLGFSLLLAVVIGALGYLVYRAGYWGAGDYFELVSISLILPVQPAPLFGGLFQFGLPFVISVLIATGFAAIWVMPLYYLVFVRKKGWITPDLKHILYGASLFLLYMILLLFVSYYSTFSITRMLLIVVVAIPSALTLVFEEQIASRMVEMVYPSRLEEGDIIAFNMMSSSEKRRFAKYAGFGRLATRELIQKIRNVKVKLPVYKNAAPLAAFIFIGVVVALLFGNIVFFII
jgi:hypothetical protein